MTNHEVYFILKNNFENIIFDNYWTFKIFNKSFSDLQIKFLLDLVVKNNFIINIEYNKSKVLIIIKMR